MQTINITAHTQDTSQIEAIKAVMKAFKIKFEIAKEKPYNPDYDTKIEHGDLDKKDGKGKKVSIEELNSLWK